MFKFSSTKPTRLDKMTAEYPLKEFVPYVGHFNDHTILTKNGALMQVIKVGGFSFETADDEDVDIAKNIRNMLFKGMGYGSSGSGKLGLYFHIIRKQHKLYPDNYTSLDMPDGFASYLDKKWINRCKYKKAYVNELYITVIHYGAIVLNFGKLKNIIQKFTALLNKDNKAQQDPWEKLVGDAYDQLEEAVGRVLTTLNSYKAELLGVKQIDGMLYTEIGGFLSSILNTAHNTKILYAPHNLDRLIYNERFFFKHKFIEIKCPEGQTKFAGIVSIKEYGPRTWAGIFDAFLRMPFEFVITQSFQFSNRQSAISKMQLQQNRMVQSGDKAISQIAAISEALDKAMSGEIAFGKHHMTIMCIADSTESLDKIISLCAVELTNTGGIGVRETVNMEPAFWGQLPSNFDFLVRAATINTLNLAAFNSLHNYPIGKQRGNFWGEAVSVLDTTSGTPYYFNFHLRDVGHTTVIGPTGGGKTVAMNFLCSQAQKFKCRLFFFDKDRGAEIFIRAMGGCYTIINPSASCGFNPLQLGDTGANRKFLVDWFRTLVSANNEQITAEEISLINEAVNGSYRLTKEDRRLRNVAPFLGLEGPGLIAERLSMWHSHGPRASLFDNEHDTLDFTESSIFGFEMGEVLKDKLSLGPVLSYLFYKINMSLDGTPTMIVLDEAWALIDNPIFGPTIKDWLKVLRKLNAFVVFATQSVEDATKSAISDTLIQQTATQIFLPNLKATSVYRTAFMLSEREFQLIKTTDPGTRFFLVKQGQDAVMARIDLSGMDDIINILSGRADTVTVLDEVRQQYGDDPNIWIPQFMKRLKHLKDA